MEQILSGQEDPFTLKKVGKYENVPKIITLLQNSVKLI